MPGKQTKLAELTGKRLRAFMLDWTLAYAEKLTIRALAAQLDVEESRCGHWVAGKIEIPPHYANELRKIYGLNTEFIYSDDPDRVTPEYLPIYRPMRRPEFT